MRRFRQFSPKGRGKREGDVRPVPRGTHRTSGPGRSADAGFRNTEAAVRKHHGGFPVKPAGMRRAINASGWALSDFGECRSGGRLEQLWQPTAEESLAARADAAQPEGLHPVAADEAARRALDPIRQGPTPLAAIPLSRQTPEVGAECVSSARSDLSGGRGVTRVPSGMRRPFHPRTSPRARLRWAHRGRNRTTSLARMPGTIGPLPRLAPRNQPATSPMWNRARSGGGRWPVFASLASMASGTPPAPRAPPRTWTSGRTALAGTPARAGVAPAAFASTL